MRKSHRLATIAALVGCASIAVAAEQTILGKSLTVKDPKPGVDATKRKVTASGKEKNSANTIVGNPTTLGLAGGGVLQVFAFGATPSSQVFTLPQGSSGFTGQQFWSASGTTGYKYKDSLGEQGPVKSVIIKRSASGSFTIKAKVAAKNGPVTVVPPNPGTSGCVALQIGVGAGFGDRYSVQFGVESQIKNSNKLFKAKKPSVEGICPGAPITTTTSTTTTPTTTTPTTTTPTTTTPTTTTPTTTTPTTTSSSSTSTTLFGSPSGAFLERRISLLD